MAKIVTCSQCNATLSVPDDMLGKLVRCPTCSITFQAPSSVPEATLQPWANPPSLPPPRRAQRAPDDWDDVELIKPELRDTDDRDNRRRPPRRDDDDDDRGWRSERDYDSRGRIDPAWITVKSGLNAMFIAATIMLGTVVVWLLLVLILFLSRRGPGNNGSTEALAGVLVCVGVLVALGGGITSLVGRFMCLAAPDVRARGFLIGHLIFLGLNVILAVVLFVLFIAMVDSRRPGDQQSMHVALALLGSLDILSLLVGAVLLSLFLKGTALNFDGAGLASGCTAFIVFETIWLLAAAALALLSLGLGPGVAEPKAIAWVIGSVVIGGVGSLVAIIWNMVLVRGCHNLIRQAQGSSRRRYYD